MIEATFERGQKSATEWPRVMKRLKPASVKVLVVADHADHRAELETLARRDGLELVRASSGAEAIELIEKEDIALIVIGETGDHDSFALAEKLRSADRSRTSPLLLVTSDKSDSDRQFPGYDAGPVEFVHRPVNPKIFANKLGTLFELCRQRLTLAEAMRSEEVFVAALAHDLRNPLNAISMSAQILATSPTSDPIQARTVTRLLSSSKRMAALIDQLCDLSWSRLRGEIAVEKKLLEVAPLVQTVVEEHKKTTSTNPIELTISGPSGNAKAYCDDARLAQVVSSLLSNALKHGKKAGRIEVGLSTKEVAVEISVHNEGALDPAVAKDLFTPFAHGTPRAGIGLGLFVVDQVVRAHGGTVSVESDVDRGTTFVVSIPRAGA